MHTISDRHIIRNMTEMMMILGICRAVALDRDNRPYMCMEIEFDKHPLSSNYSIYGQKWKALDAED